LAQRHTPRVSVQQGGDCRGNEKNPGADAKTLKIDPEFTEKASVKSSTTNS
jgi:hypothetical protein